MGLRGNTGRHQRLANKDAARLSQQRVVHPTVSFCDDLRSALKSVQWGMGWVPHNLHRSVGCHVVGARAKADVIAPRHTICMHGNKDCAWPRGVTVSTLDSESSDRGSNPREASFVFVLPCLRLSAVNALKCFNGW